MSFHLESYLHTSTFALLCRFIRRTNAQVIFHLHRVNSTSSTGAILSGIRSGVWLLGLYTIRLWWVFFFFLFFILLNCVRLWLKASCIPIEPIKPRSLPPVLRLRSCRLSACRFHLLLVTVILFYSLGSNLTVNANFTYNSILFHFQSLRTTHALPGDSALILTHSSFHVSKFFFFGRPPC